MNSLIEHIYETKSVEDPEGNSLNPFPTAIRYDQGMTIYELIRRMKLENTLEIGMAYGLATLFICQAHHDNGVGRHIAIDPMESSLFKSIGLSNIRKAGLDHVFDLFEAPSYEILPQLLSNGEQFDFAFIDGMHLFDYTLVDFFYIDRLLKPGGYIMVDDVWMPAIRKVLAFILRNKIYRLAPEFFWKLPPLWKRSLKFTKNVVQDPFERYQARRFIKNIIRDPFDLYSVGFAGFLLARGRLNYWVIQKVSDDERNWDHYKTF